MYTRPPSFSHPPASMRWQISDRNGAANGGSRKITSNGMAGCARKPAASARTVRARSQPSLALVPFLFLTGISEPATARVKGFRLGADDFVEKGCPAEELRLRIEGIFHRKQQLVGARAQTADFGGTLAAFGVATVLQMVAQECKTGTVSFDGPGGTARVVVANGAPHRAELPDLGLRGEEVVYAVLAWETGSFRFVSGSPDGPREIEASMQGLLLEGARRIDEHLAGTA